MSPLSSKIRGLYIIKKSHVLIDFVSRSKTNDDKGWISDDEDRKSKPELKLELETTNPRRRRASRSIPRRKSVIVFKASKMKAEDTKNSGCDVGGNGCG